MSKQATRSKGKAQARQVIPERDVQAQCLEALAMLAVNAVRRNTGQGQYANADGSTRVVPFGEKGDPDIAGDLDGRRFALEVKREGKRPTPEQYGRLDAINEAGGVAFWVDNAEILFTIIPRVRAGWRVYLDRWGGVCLTDEPPDWSIEGWKGGPPS